MYITKTKSDTSKVVSTGNDVLYSCVLDDDAVATVEWTARTKEDVEMSEIIANSIADGLPKPNYPE